MGRMCKIDQLPVEQGLVVKNVVRKHRYNQVDAMRAELDGLNITVSRSALHRFVLKLKHSDALCANPDEETIVTIVERSSGEVRVIKTSAKAEIVAAVISSLTASKQLQ